MKVEYNEEYYSRNYGKDYFNSQQKWFDDYLYNKGTGFTLRVKFILKLINQYLKEGVLLDLGCGVGTFALLLAQKGFKTIGVDISKGAILRCQENAKKLNLKNTEFILGNTIQNHFDKDTFDGIICADIIEHLSDDLLNKTLKNCHKWLKNNGVLIIHTFPSYYYYLLVDIYMILLIPTLILPKKMRAKYISIVDKLYQIFYLFRNGKTYTQYISNTSHCNPQDPQKFKQLLIKTGFKIKKYKMIQIILTDLETDKPFYKRLGRLLIKRNILLCPSIVAIVNK